MAAFVWQLMRNHIVHTLKTISKKGRDVSDEDILRWANETVKKSGKNTKLHSFKDSTIKTGMFLLDLLHGMSPGVVNFAGVTPGKTGTIVGYKKC